MLKPENMKSRILMIYILLLVFCKFGFAQRIVVDRVNFSNIPIVNNEVQVNYDSQTVLKVGFLLARPVQEPWGSLPIKGEIKVFYYKDNQEVNIIDVVTFNKSNWDNSVYSNFIERDIFLPAYSVSVANPKIQVLTKWRYYKEGYPDPETTNGWTEWYSAGSITFALNPDRVPPSTFSGPNSTCGESVYTISNPYTVSLENATGVATLTALGNNQWKVTRIGNAVGTVYLRSTYQGKVFNYPIEVSSEMKGTIDGPVGIKQGWNDNYFYFKPEPGMDYTNVNWPVDSPHLITTQVDKFTFKISVPTNYPLMDKGRGDDVEIYIRSNGECGVMEKSRILRILPARPIKN